MKEFINKYKREVIVGVVVSLLTTGIIEVWDWIILAAPAYGKNIISTIDNLTYALAATQSTSSLIRTIASCLLGVLLASWLTTIHKGLSAYANSRKMEKLYNQVKKGEFSGIDKYLAERKTEESPNRQAEKSIKSGKSLGWLTVIMVLLVIFMYVFTNTAILKPSQLWSSFENDLTMIAPYVDEADILQLKSDWVCMREKADYDEIYEYIDSVKEEYALPQ